MEFSIADKKAIIQLTGSITAGNADELEDRIASILAQTGATVAELSATGLDYISSAGLRVIMRLLKRLDEVSVTDASNGVYDVFEMTGLTELMRVGRRAREMSVEGCELIGEGGFGKVYRTDPETIVKVYAPTCTREFVDGERERARSVFVLGVPTAIPYDLVRVGESWGLVFELLDADTVARVVDREPDRVDELAHILGGLLKELHAIEVPAGRLPNKADIICRWCTDVVGPFLEPDELKVITGYLDAIPVYNTFLHGDYHSKNIMLKDGAPLLIDVGDAAMGNPLIDWAQMGLNYLLLPGAVRSGGRPQSLLGYDPDLAAPLWRGQIGAYLGTEDEGRIADFQASIMPLMWLLASYNGANIAGNTPEAIQTRVEQGIRPRAIPAMLNAPAFA